MSADPDVCPHVAGEHAGECPLFAWMCEQPAEKQKKKKKKKKNKQKKKKKKKKKKLLLGFCLPNIIPWALTATITALTFEKVAIGLCTLLLSYY